MRCRFTSLDPIVGHIKKQGRREGCARNRSPDALLSPKSPPPTASSPSSPPCRRPSPALLPPRNPGGCRIRRIPDPPMPTTSRLSLTTWLLPAPPAAADLVVRRILPPRSTIEGPLALHRPPIWLDPVVTATKAHPRPSPHG